jgi:hypothetical protein
MIVPAVNRIPKSPIDQKEGFLRTNAALAKAKTDAGEFSKKLE